MTRVMRHFAVIAQFNGLFDLQSIPMNGEQKGNTNHHRARVFPSYFTRQGDSMVYML
jgi:hypothetical protein